MIIDNAEIRCSITESSNAGASFTLSDIETVGNVGGYNDLKIFDSSTYMGCYRDQGVGSLRFSRTDDTGASWTTTLVDGAGLQGRQCSLVIIDSNTVYISAGADSTNDLYFYKSTDGGVNWSRTSVDTNAEPSRYTTVTTANNGNTVYISYHLTSGSFVKFAKSVDAGATWSVSNIEADGLYSSMVGFDNTLYVGWLNHALNTVRVAKTVNGGTTWSVTTVDAFADVRSLETSMAGVDANHIYMTYNDKRRGLLKLAQTADAGVSWITSVVDDIGNPGLTQFVDALSTNTLGIMYQALDNNDLRFAYSDAHVFDGDDVISAVKVTHTDLYGNQIENENVAVSTALATVRPLVPLAPTVTGLTPTSVSLVVQPNSLELGNVEYSIRFVSAGPTTQYVQSDSTLGLSPDFLTYSGWNTTFGVVVTPIIDGVIYTIDVNARNPNGDQVASAYSADAVFPQAIGGSSIARLTVNTPTAANGVAISDSTIRWYFTDNANNEAGFNLYVNDEEQFSVPGENLSFIEETGLIPNTLYSGRRVSAFVGSNKSARSEELTATATHLSPLSLVVEEVRKDSLVVRTSVSVPNATVGQTAFQFERLAAEQAPVEQSSWQQGQLYFFDGLQPDTLYYFRVRGRNQLGVDSEWSQAFPLSTLEQEAPSLTFHLQLSSSETGQSSNSRFNPFQKIGGQLSLKNIGMSSATNVLATLPLPEGLDLVPSSFLVDGAKQTTDADTDAGQYTGHAISTVWDRVRLNTQHNIQFQLAFNIDVLNRISNETDVSLERVVAQVLDEATFTLQAVLTYSELAEQQYSESVSVTVSTATSDLDPDADVQPIVPPQLVTTPIPTPIIIETAPTEIPSPGQPSNQEAPNCINSSPTTDSSYDGVSFSLSVQDCNARLEVVGNAQVEGEQILFSGGTSEPYTFVTLMLNNSVTVIAVSDARGEWRTYVDAGQLGLQRGTELVVSIQAMTAKGTVQSELRPVGTVRLSLGQEGAIIADFETVVSTSNLLTVANEFAKKTTEIVADAEPVVQTALTVTAPILIASSVPLWGYLPYVPTLVWHFFGSLLGYLGRRKKRDDNDPTTFGVVYDSITKVPLPLAIVRTYNIETNKLASTTVTDKHGRYDLLLPPSRYKIEVSKPQYQFPSAIVSTLVDGTFNRVYPVKVGISITTDSSAAPHIPVDPFNVQRQWQLSFGSRKLWLAFQRFGDHIATPIMIAGFVTSMVLVYSVPGRAMNWMLFGMYAITLTSQLKLKPKIVRAWGVVYDLATDALLPLTAVQLIDPASSKVVSSRLTAYEGRFTFLPEPGHYVVKASKPGFEQVQEVVKGYVDRQQMPAEVSIEKPNQRISGDIAMKPLS